MGTDGSELLIGNIPIPGAPSVLRMFATCPACQNAPGLLKLAAPHATSNTTHLERAVIAGS